MNKIFSIIMYVLWIATIILVLAATFTNFKYEDLNVLAIVALVFAILNSIFMVPRKK